MDSRLASVWHGPDNACETVIVAAVMFPWLGPNCKGTFPPRTVCMKAVVFDQPGDPAEVLQVRDVPVPVPGFREVRVRMLAAPINPSDLLTIAGRYAKPPQLPATPGYEGVGIVEATGGGLLGWLRKGKRVAVINERTGTWQEQCVVPAKFVVPVPADVPDEQAAMFFVNPITAVVMVRRGAARAAWKLAAPDSGGQRAGSNGHSTRQAGRLPHDQRGPPPRASRGVAESRRR